ncbi:MAG: ABC transporter substrate-binding protein [Wenzhouxiangella sp.]
MHRASLFLTLALALPAGADSDGLTIATWGGAYEAVQREVLFEPFTQRTGIEVHTVPYSGGTEILDRSPDLVDMAMSEAIAACHRDRLLALDHDELPPGANGTPAVDDFIGGAMHRCALTHTVYATVIAYDSRAFPSHPPARIRDLFDLETFPGKRALRRTPGDNLEWALMSSGVPRREIYSLLSTPRGLDLAFRRLDRIRDDLVWWEDGDEPVELLESGAVVMASGYNGRFFNARLDESSPIEIIWDGQIQEYQTWVIPAGADRPEAARQFIRFATGTEPLAALAERIAYGPARKSAARQVLRHPEAGIDMRPHIPTHPYNSANAIGKDVQWYATTMGRIRERFERWLKREQD